MGRNTYTLGADCGVSLSRSARAEPGRAGAAHRGFRPVKAWWVRGGMMRGRLFSPTSPTTHRSQCTAPRPSSSLGSASLPDPSIRSLSFHFRASSPRLALACSPPPPAGSVPGGLYPIPRTHTGHGREACQVPHADSNLFSAHDQEAASLPGAQGSECAASLQRFAPGLGIFPHWDAGTRRGRGRGCARGGGYR